MEIGTLYRKRNTVEKETVQKKKRNEEGNSISCSDSPAEYECIMNGLEFVIHSYDIGLYVNSSTPLTDDLKYNLLVNTFTPPHDYNFKGDSTGIRSFRHIWLIRYSPWLCYSSYLKGPFCKYCIVFPQPDLCGRQGGFIMVPFVRYNDFHVCAKKHMSSAWHKSAEVDATNFLTSMNVFETNFACQLDSSINRIVNENRKKLQSILSTIVFCGTHDIPLHGETRTTGDMQSLLAFRVEAGDVTLREHLENEAGNARDTSVQIENELIKLCVDAIREEIVSAANGSAGFSVLVGESTKISGEDHLSLGIRFVDTTGAKPQVREEFLGFAALKGWDAACTAATIIEECTKYGLNLEKLCGQGYDGCSKLAGRESGVQAKIKSRYPKATFVHCAAHTLNLVVNDLNAVPEIRNAVGTIKAILRFFRENLSRRHLILAVPSLDEALWTAKYKHVRFFSKNFVQILDQLRNLAATASGQICQDAYQLYCASGTPNFLFCLVIMSNYCSKLESVTQALQTVQLDMMKVYEHIQELLTVFRGHREKAEEHFKRIFSEVQELADKLDIDLRIPRRSDLQRNSNADVPTEEEYFRQSLYIPYLNSIISWLESRFAPESKAVFGIFSLHPQKMAHIGLETLKAEMEKISELCEIENLETETITWFEKWLGKKEERIENGKNGLLDLLQYVDQYPSIQQAISIALALPITTCTMEKSFSTMSRVETLLKSTLVDDQLPGLCMISAHRIKINENKDVLLQKVMDRFGEDNKHLQFVFEK